MKSLPTLFRNLKFYTYQPHAPWNARTFHTKFKSIPILSQTVKRHNVSFGMKELGQELDYINKLERENASQLQLRCMLALVDSIVLNPEHQYEKEILAHIIGIYYGLCIHTLFTYICIQHRY